LHNLAFYSNYKFKKMKKQLPILLSILMPCLLNAQIDKNLESVFKEFQKAITQQFISFSDSINSVFVQALEEQWEEFQVFEKIPAPVKPNPKTPPIADTLKSKPVISVEIPVKEVVPPQKEESKYKKEEEDQPHKPKEEPKPKFPEEPSIFFNHKEIRLWNRTYKIPHDISLENLSLLNTQEKSVAEFWRSLSQTDYKSVIDAIAKIQNQCDLNIYGLVLLCREYSIAVWANKTQNFQNEATILLVFLLNQFSLDAKIIRTVNRLEAVLHSPQTVYTVSFVELQGKPYYFLFSTIEPSSVYTYKINFSEKLTGLDFNVYKPVSISNVLIDKELVIKKLNKKIRLTYSQSAIEYYKNYPQVDADIYTNAIVSDVFRNSVIHQFNPLLAGKTEYEAVDILLNFMQYAFEYQTDDIQFGREKWNFCEENLYYPFNDCDDRAILFSYLVRELLDLDVALILFSDHMSAAVRFNIPITGDYLTIDGQKYIICDPTYIGSTIGMNPPKYKNEQAEIVRTKKI